MTVPPNHPAIETDVLANIARGWNRAPVGVARGGSPTGISAALWTHDQNVDVEVRAEPDSRQHIVALQMCGQLTGELSIDGRRVIDGPTRVGMVNLVRAGERPAGVIRGRFKVMHVYVPAALLDNLVAEDGSGRGYELIDPAFARDPTIERIAQDLLQEMRGGLALSRLRVDTLGQDLAIHLLRRWSSLSDSASSSRWQGGLSPAQLRRVLERLRNDLTDDVPLAELASLTGLSRSHFCTAFRASTGEPPHRWLLQRRIERAKELLVDTRASVTEIAYAVGFGSSAHFATAFKKKVGSTPSAYRRARTF